MRPGGGPIVTGDVTSDGGVGLRAASTGGGVNTLLPEAGAGTNDAAEGEKVALPAGEEKVREDTVA